MNAQRITDEELLLYACDELEAARKAEVEAALGNDPCKAAQAMALRSSFSMARPHEPTDQPAVRPSAGLAERLKRRLRDELREAGPIPISEEVAADRYRRRRAEAAEVLDEFDEQILLWAFDQLPHEQQQKVEARLAKSPHRAAEALALRHAIHLFEVCRPPLPAGFESRLRERLVSGDHRQDDSGVGDRPCDAPATAGAFSDDGTTRRLPLRPINWRFRRSSLALAACVCACGLVWIMFFGHASTSAYSLADMPKRVQQLGSLYLKGKVYRRTDDGEEPTMRAHPVEQYVARPNRYYYREGGPYPASMATDGLQYMRVQGATAECALGRAHPFATRLLVESCYQKDLVSALAGDLSWTYSKLRAETIDGVATEVYEQVRDHGDGRKERTVLWFNPESGLPVKSQKYFRDRAGLEYLHAEFDQIQPDHPAPRGMFVFEPPAGYGVVHRDQHSDDMPMVSTSSPDGRHGVLRFIFNISDRAILLCWGYYDDSGTYTVEPGLHDPNGPELSVRPQSWEVPWPHRRHLLRVDPREGHHWRWLLMVPDGNGAIPDGGGYTFTFNAETPYAESVFSAPLKFDRHELVQWLAEAQALSLPKDAPAGSAFTLEQLEALIRE